MKSTFILRANYDDLFQDLTPQQAGEVIQAVFAHVHNRPVPPFSSAEARITFKCIEKDITFDLNKYEQTCKKRQEAAQKRWTTKHAKKCKCIPNEDDEIRTDENITSTAQPPAHSKDKSSRYKTQLQLFSNQVLERFEPPMSPTQKAIWFKRNCRCLSDILNFCNQDITLALQTIHVCAQRLQQAGLSGGYEAVCRNLPDYMTKAQKQLEEEYGPTK